MATILNNHFRIATTVSTILLCTSISSHTFAMNPFQANYQFSYNGKNLGSATRTLSKNGNNWTYIFAARAGVIASATETSRFSFSNGKIGSNSFSRSSKVLIHNNTMNINFNPGSKIIKTQKDEKTRSFAWAPGVLDELNAELQIREDLKASGLKSHYPIADAKGIASRRFVQQGKEIVKTSYGNFETIKVKIEHGKPERNTMFWLAPKLDYLPVKVSHQDGNSSYGLLLTGYKGLSN